MPNPNAPSSGEETGGGKNFDMGDVKDFDAHMEEVESNGSGEEVSEVEETAEIDDSGTFKHNPEAYKEMYPDAVDDVEQARVEAIAGDADEAKAAHHLDMAEAALLDDDEAYDKAEDKLMEDYYHGEKTVVDAIKKDFGTTIDEAMDRAEDRQKAADEAEAKAAEQYDRLQNLRKR